MIYTLTLNPSIDYHVWLNSLSQGEIHTVEKEQKVAGGKGVNVSKVLKLLGMNSVALGFIGGFTGEFIKNEIESLGVSHDLVSITGDSRINIKIKADTETDISGLSPVIPESALKLLFSQLERLTSQDILVLAGSVPESLPKDIYQNIMNRLEKKDVHIFLDSKGDALKSCLLKRPFLIKPNHHELGELLQVKIESPIEALAYGKRVVEMGAQNVIVSLAEQGAVFVSAQEAYMAKIPSYQPVNSIGAGDSMVAGFLFSYLQEQSIESVFRFAVAAGTATALSEGFCTPDTIKEILPQVLITRS
ncbi:MAG TPA: 1-phosphofructokinase [Bacillota bacterium]|nr:1-phosphofructokinase [Bacillota bacterium]